MSFLESLQKNTNIKYTENGAITNASSLDANLDFFALAGAMRDRPDDAVNLFERAYFADKLTAVRTLFYLRDIRGGQGEREIFRKCFLRLAKLDETTAVALLEHISEYGRWDDLIKLLEFKNQDSLLDMAIMLIIADKLSDDIVACRDGKSISLLAKWLPSINTSSKRSVALAKDIAKRLRMSPVAYRKILSELRKHIILLETQMSANQWSDIDYSKLPSQAGRKHVKAFKKHDEERYTNYLDQVVKGKAKMNTSTLFTYEVFNSIKSGDIDAANAMWTALPDYTNGRNALVVADVSGSMDGLPMSISVSLALYFAEHNEGPFHNKFMTFSSTPEVVEVVGNTLEQKMQNIEDSEWGMSTNLEGVFNVLLKSALDSEASQEDMPSVLYIISDMEFDSAISSPDESIFDNAKNKFRAKGYQLPHVVFWNVDSRQNQAPATKYDNSVTLISGSSQSTFRYAVEGKSPKELMLEVINSERYTPITI